MQSLKKVVVGLSGWLVKATLSGCAIYGILIISPSLLTMLLLSNEGGRARLSAPTFAFDRDDAHLSGKTNRNQPDAKP